MAKDRPTSSDDRTQLAADLLLAGVELRMVRSRVRATYQRKPTEAQVEKVIAAGRDEVARRGRELADGFDGLVMSRLEHLWRQALEQGDLRVAVRILREQETRAGIIAPAEEIPDEPDLAPKPKVAPKTTRGAAGAAQTSAYLRQWFREHHGGDPFGQANDDSMGDAG